MHIDGIFKDIAENPPNEYSRERERGAIYNDCCSVVFSEMSKVQWLEVK